jgi:hypothetical protein
MAKREVPGQFQYPPEFEQWLKSKKVRKRDIRRNPDLLHSYQREWQQEASPKRRRRRSPLSILSKMDLDQIGSHLNRANEMLGIIQGLKGMIGPKNLQRDE